MIRIALWPSVVLATVGVALTAAVVGTAAVWLFHLSWTEALLIGAVLAPTDAAAVNTLLRAARVAVPQRVSAALEVESGLNDPMSVFLTVLLVQSLTSSGNSTIGVNHSALLFTRSSAAGVRVFEWTMQKLRTPRC